MIGNTASAALGRCFDQSLRAFEVAVDSGYDFTQLPDFGETLHNNIHEWFSVEENRILWEELKPMVNIEKKETAMSVVQDNPFAGKTLVVTARSSRTPVTASMRRYILWVRKPEAPYPRIPTT